MSADPEKTSSSPEDVKKKRKRYLYLDKFESYKESNDAKVDGIDKRVSSIETVLYILAGCIVIANLIFIYLL